MEMSTVEKSQDTAWNHVLDTKGLSAAAPILEEYGLSCESDMSLVNEEDLMVLCSKLKQFQSGVQLALQMLDLRKVQSSSIARDKSISEKCRGR